MKDKVLLPVGPKGYREIREQHFGLKVLNDDDDDDGRTAGSIPRRDAAVRNLQKGLRVRPSKPLCVIREGEGEEMEW